MKGKLLVTKEVISKKMPVPQAGDPVDILDTPKEYIDAGLIMINHKTLGKYFVKIDNVQVIESPINKKQ